ncbi:MAG: DivIVA domain-containing protein [Deltaproteobacteria bacterium]|nr:DivIVA domain-containing protein [Deltaproteobacteria bacterium]
MPLTALDIQQQRFRTKVRGVDPKEVQTFLEQAAAAFEDLQREHHRLTGEVRQLRGEIDEHRKREGTFKRALMQSQKVLDQMKVNAEKQADLIVTEAENKAEKLLHQAQRRLSQLQEDITKLKRQRVQIEVEIGYVIESHRRLLTLGQEQIRATDEQDEKLKVLKKAI